MSLIKHLNIKLFKQTSFKNIIKDAEKQKFTVRWFVATTVQWQLLLKYHNSHNTKIKVSLVLKFSDRNASLQKKALKPVNFNLFYFCLVVSAHQW